MKRLPIIVMTLLLAASVARAGDEVNDFFIPGVDFSEITFQNGAWCRYVVVDEALGQTDSTDVYIGMPGVEETPHGYAYWIEIETRPRGAAAENVEVLKLLVLEEITEFAEGDSLGDYVLELYNRVGTRPPRKEEPQKYEDLRLVVPTADSSWVATYEVPVRTKAGKFSCTQKKRTVETDKEIPTGKVKLIKKARDGFTVWFNTEIPVFHMAKCVVDRSRETITVPRVPGIPEGGVKESRTTAEIVAYGLDAKPIMAHESIERETED